ncbi:hypothetical protein M5K25_006995 [Dendrobium thyrsiflorum]|uniref:Uncharacterized protein n=1 Tax=Dendrobium thyrsiflorum TaxID=117978 RepID=A0ABD0VD83_DENTH
MPHYNHSVKAWDVVVIGRGEETLVAVKSWSSETGSVELGFEFGSRGRRGNQLHKLTEATTGIDKNEHSGHGGEVCFVIGGHAVSVDANFPQNVSYCTRTALRFVPPPWVI